MVIAHKAVFPRKQFYKIQCSPCIQLYYSASGFIVQLLKNFAMISGVLGGIQDANQENRLEFINCRKNSRERIFYFRRPGGYHPLENPAHSHCQHQHGLPAVRPGPGYPAGGGSACPASASGEGSFFLDLEANEIRWHEM